MKNKRMASDKPKKAKVGYMHGGMIKKGIKPTNQKTMTVRGGGAATQGLKYKG